MRDVMKNSLLYKEIAYLIHRGLLKIDPRIEMSRCYHKLMGGWPNFRNPKSLIEKIYWLQLHSDTSKWSKCADKYLVRDYLVEKGCGQYLNELYGKWNSPSEIAFDRMPDRYILKMNNACGQMIIVDKGNGINENLVKERLQWWVDHPFGVSGGELHYLNIKPCIIAEKLLAIPEGETSLVDYKIWCFSGEPYCVFVTYGRTEKKFNFALFDLNWNPLIQYIRNTNHAIFIPDNKIARPDSFEEMLSLAKKLSKGFPEVRVDLYEVDKRPVFGEMTFSTGFGYFTDEFYRILGDRVVLPVEKY